MVRKERESAHQCRSGVWVSHRLRVPALFGVASIPGELWRCHVASQSRRLCFISSSWKLRTSAVRLSSTSSQRMRKAVPVAGQRCCCCCCIRLLVRTATTLRFHGADVTGCATASLFCKPCWPQRAHCPTTADASLLPRFCAPNCRCD